MRRISWQTLAVAAIMLSMVPPAQAQVDLTDVAFTVSVDEPADAPAPQPEEGLDLVEIALGEPGDGTVVFRATLAGEPSTVSAGSRLYFGFTTDAGDVVGGCNYSGTPTTRNIGEAIAPDACVVAGAVVYAIYAYETIETAMGMTITQIWGFTDGCVPNAGCLPGDTAPGGVANQGWPATTFGADYALTGCTRAAGCAGSAASGPVETLNGTTVSVGRTFTNVTTTTDTFVWTTNLTAAQVDLNATVGNGSVHLTIVDGANATVVNRTIDTTGVLTIPIESAAPGNWSIVVAYSNFTGNLTFSVGAIPPVVPEPTTSSTTTTTEEERTGTFPLRKDDRGSPGPGVILLGLAFVALALMARRRLA